MEVGVLLVLLMEALTHLMEVVWYHQKLLQQDSLLVTGCNQLFSPTGQLATTGCGTIETGHGGIPSVSPPTAFDGWQMKITSVGSTNTSQPTSAFLGIYDFGLVAYPGSNPPFFAFTGKSDLNGNCGAATTPANMYWPWAISSTSYPQQVQRNCASGAADCFNITVQFLKNGNPIQLN